MTETLRGTLDLEEIPVILTSKGEDYHYVLRKLDGKERDEYIQFLSKRVNFDAQGNAVGMNNPAGIQRKLLSLSLRDAQGKLVGSEFCGKLPTDTMDLLYEAARKLSGLDDEASEQAGNDSGEESD